MKDLRFEFNTLLEMSAKIREHDFLLRCVPRIAPEQRLAGFHLAVTPLLGQGCYSRDAFGNTVFFGHIDEEHDNFRYNIEGRIVRDDSLRVPEKPMACYSYPSAMTHPDAAIKAFLQEAELSGGVLQQMQELSELLHGYFDYEPGSTNVATTASEAFKQKKGVCQDFAHVFVTMARLLGHPARYVCGLPYGEGTTHAWAEVWHEGLWYGFDPTRNKLTDEDYIVLSVGRDYRDCPVERGVFRGGADQLQTVFMRVRPS